MTSSLSFRTALNLVFVLQAVVVVAVTAFSLSEREVNNGRVLDQMQGLQTRLATAADQRTGADGRVAAARPSVLAVRPADAVVVASR